MIEVRQRNSKGITQFIGTYTEFEFARKYDERKINELFSNDDKENKFWTDWNAEHYKCGHLFKHTAYNSRGKLLTVDYLIGVVRAINRAYYSKWRWSYRQKKWVKRNSDSNWMPGAKRGNYSYFRHIRTFQERRWANAWDDEEFAPKIRATRNKDNLPNNWDDIGRGDYNNRNWKHHRKHQWKEKED